MLDLFFVVAAIVGGTIMVCQFLLTLIGINHDVGDSVGDMSGVHGDFHAGYDGDFAGHGDVGNSFHGGTSEAASHHDGSDADEHHGNGSRIFGMISFRTLVAATAFFGVAGRAASSAGVSQPKSLALALLAGAAAMYGMYWLMHSLWKLTSSGNERIASALGRQGAVYIPIPAHGQGA